MKAKACGAAFPHMKRNGNLYPTHGLGPVAHYMDIHRGDRFDYMVSVSSSEASLSAYVKANFADGDPKRAEKYICGDMNTSIIKTQKGRTILLQHDVVNPRPYSRLNSISGTKGIFADYPPRIFVDGTKQAMAQEGRLAEPSMRFATSTSTRSGRQPEKWPAKWAATAEWTTS